MLYIIQLVAVYAWSQVDGEVKTNHFSGAAYLISLLLTLMTTFLIAYRIHSSTKSIPMSKSKTRLKKILEILLQSAFLYTASLLGYLVLSFVHLSYSDAPSIQRAAFFAEPVLFFAAVRFSLTFSLCINDTEILEYRTYPHGCAGQFFPLE